MSCLWTEMHPIYSMHANICQQITRNNYHSQNCITKTFAIGSDCKLHIKNDISGAKLVFWTQKFVITNESYNWKLYSSGTYRVVLIKCRCEVVRFPRHNWPGTCHVRHLVQSRPTNPRQSYQCRLSCLLDQMRFHCFHLNNIHTFNSNAQNHTWTLFCSSSIAVVILGKPLDFFTKACFSNNIIYKLADLWLQLIQMCSLFHFVRTS